MLKLRVIPCLDVKDGRVVKGVNFVSLRDAGDPVEQAAVYDAAGADELTFLDITASHENRDTIYDVVSRTAARVFLPLTVGGGVRSTGDMRKLLLAGADKCSMNSAAIARPALVAEAAEKFGSQCVVVAVDARATAPGRWEVFTHGGRKPAGLDAVAWCQQAASLGAGEILLTSMDRDGTGAGFDGDLLRAVCAAVRVPVVASGGVGALQHFVEGAQAGATGLLAASRLPLRQLQHAEVKQALPRPGCRSAARPRHRRHGQEAAKRHRPQEARKSAKPPARSRRRPRPDRPVVLDRLWAVILERRTADPAVSHSARLLSRGRAKVAQKFGEEAVECLIEAVAGNADAVVAESADVLYHLLVLWVAAVSHPPRSGRSWSGAKACRAWRRRRPGRVAASGSATRKIP